MTEREVEELEELEGWINAATFHAATVIFNDAQLLGQIDAMLHVGALMSALAMDMRMERRLPEGLNAREIDWWSIQLERADELRRSLVISGALRGKIAESLGCPESECRRRRLDLLRRHGMPHADPYFDHMEFYNQKYNVAMDEIINQTTEVTIMKIETKHFVNGAPIDRMSLEERVALIASTEKKIEELAAIKTESKMITGEIAKLKKFLAEAVALFDATL